MKIVGYVYNAATYCVKHKPTVEPQAWCNEPRACRDSDCHPQPIFDTDEGWQDMTCDVDHTDTFLRGISGGPTFVTLEEA